MLSDRTPMVVYHLGAHKTATTLFQRALLANRAYLLLQRTRVIVPAAAMQLLRPASADSSVDRRQLFPFNQRWRVPLFKRAIVTNEELLGRPFRKSATTLYPDATSRAALLKSVAGNHLVKVVFCIRPQADFVESWYIQTIMMGSTLPFEKFLESIRNVSLSWRPACKALVAAFGHGNVAVVDFRLIQEGSAVLLGKLARECGVRLRPSSVTLGKQNRSLSREGLQLALMANSLLGQRDKRRFRAFLQQSFSNANRERPTLLGAARKTEMTDKWQADYETLLGEFPNNVS